MHFTPRTLVALAALPILLLAAAAPRAENAAAQPSAPPARLAKMAPADEYFGKLKLSFLGINNTFRDTAISAGAHTTDPALASKLDFAIDALNDWQRKFPHDPQLARTYFLAQITLKKFWIQKYQDKAWSYMQHILVEYPATFYGKAIKADLARGFTRHYYAPAVPCDASATPAPSVTTDNGKYKTVVETAPCITPSPSPSPSPEATLPPVATPPAAPVSAPPAGGTPPPPVAVPSATPPAAPAASPPVPATPQASPGIAPAATPRASPTVAPTPGPTLVPPAAPAATPQATAQPAAPTAQPSAPTSAASASPQPPAPATSRGV